MKNRIKDKLKNNVFLINNRGIDLLTRDGKVKYPRVILSGPCTVRVTGSSVFVGGIELVPIKTYNRFKKSMRIKGWIEKSFLKNDKPLS